MVAKQSLGWTGLMSGAERIGQAGRGGVDNSELAGRMRQLNAVVALALAKAAALTL